MQSTLPIPVAATQDSTPLSESLAGKALMTIAATGLMAICAHVSLPLYFTPVPLTLQTFAVILIGLALGPALGFSAMLLYLAEGAAGMPVFSPHRLGGVAQLLGPTGGYLMSYPFAAAAAGAIVRAIGSRRAEFAAAIVAGAVASLFIFGMGPAWLAHLTHLNASSTWRLAIQPFLPGEVIKVAAAASLFSALDRWKRA